MKRFKRLIKESPNPLFEKWLTEWKEEAIANQCEHQQYLYNRALKSLKKYPFRLESGAECIILENFGKKLCDKLDAKLKEYKKGFTEAEWSAEFEVKRRKIETEPSNRKTCSQKKDSPVKNLSEDYMPKYRSGAYAIILSLKNGPLTKDEIVVNGQEFCDSSFAKPLPGSHYTAWSSMSSLIKKQLIEKINGKPIRFSLTECGYRLLKRLDDTTASSTIKLPVASNKTSQSSSSQEIPKDVDDKPFQTVFLLPRKFDIILLIDCQETETTKKDDDMTTKLLRSQNILTEVRRLNVGDFVWIAKDRETGNELVLPYIVERKRMDDLASSIKDGRFHEQKFRLKACGLENLIYLVEKYGKDNHRLGLPLSTVQQAAMNTQLVDGFLVKVTKDHQESMRYLGCLTKHIIYFFKDKTLMSSRKSDISPANMTEDLVSLITFKDFNKSANKNKKLTVKDILTKHLIQLKGISVDKAIALTDRYPTPKLLISALSEPKGEKAIAEISYGAVRRCIGPAIARTLHQFYTLDIFP